VTYTNCKLEAVGYRNSPRTESRVKAMASSAVQMWKYCISCIHGKI